MNDTAQEFFSAIHFAILDLDLHNNTYAKLATEFDMRQGVTVPPELIESFESLLKNGSVNGIDVEQYKERLIATKEGVYNKKYKAELVLARMKLAGEYEEVVKADKKKDMHKITQIAMDHLDEIFEMGLITDADG
jgi:hypothetical protein